MRSRRSNTHGDGCHPAGAPSPAGPPAGGPGAVAPPGRCSVPIASSLSCASIAARRGGGALTRGGAGAERHAPA